MQNYKVIKKSINEIDSGPKSLIDFVYKGKKIKKKKSLKGILKGVKISKEDVEKAKKSLFPDNRLRKPVP